MSAITGFQMLRASAIAICTLTGLAGAALSGGCADIMKRSTIAPEWFQAKAVEVKGEGYPRLADIPDAETVSGVQAEWEAQAAALKAEAAEIEAASAAGGAIPSDDELRAKAAQLRARVEGDEAADKGQP